MAKDPAVLFYYQDFLTGTQFLTHKEVGQYIRILCHLADKEKLTEKQVLSICQASAIPENIKDKLLIDKEGFFYNKRMREEKEKRKIFTESRRENAQSSKKKKDDLLGLGNKNPQSVKAYAEHMENRDENINKDINKELIKVWISTFGRNPNLMEQEETEKHFKEFGIDKTKRIYKEAYKKGFRNVFKLTEQLNPDGSIKPKDGETPKPHYNRNPLAGIGQ